MLASTSRSVRPLAVVLAGLVTAALLALLPQPADAGTRGKVLPEERQDGPSAVFRSSFYLCYGYASCESKGMGNAGYAQNNRTMYWRMYAGHNCTNYAAYRMVRSGLPNVRPWSGGGNAMYWGTSMPRITDGTPQVGAVAWWKAHAGPAGSVGHVAYVEKVVSANEVIVSQDSWGGDFSWAVITRASGNWPSGFIHFNDLALTNTAAPTISGVAKVGARLAATAGTWQPADVTLAYQWSADGQPIAGATGRRYRATQAVVGAALTVTVTASKAGLASRSVTSAPTTAVLPGTLLNTAAPSVSGTPMVDQVLTADTGAWNPAPSRLDVRWLADGAPLATQPADPARLTVTPDLVGRRLAVQVTAVRDGYADVSAASAPTEPVTEASFASVARPTVTGAPRLGQVLRVDPGVSQPAAAAVTVQWLRDGQPVPGAATASYELTDSDLGHRLTAAVTRTRSGYQPAAARSPRTWRVKAVPTIHLRARALRAHGVRVVVHLRAAGGTPVDGRVVVRVANGRAETTATNGWAVATVPGLARGERQIRVRYAGSPTVTRVVGLGSVLVR